MAGMRMPGMRQPSPMFKPSAEPEEIVIEDDNDAPVVISQTRRAPVPRGGPRGRARRGRPRLDPDTDLGNNLINDKIKLIFFPTLIFLNLDFLLRNFRPLVLFII